MKDVIALLNCHNSPELGELTSNRPLASTSFLGRYAFMDFAMSNFANSGIETLGILCKNHQRSLLKHMGNMSSWVSNTKLGRTIVFYNEKGVLNEAYNTDLNNIRENDWILFDSNAKTILIAAPHVLMTIDFAPYIERHRATGEAITAIYKSIDDADKSFLNRPCLEIGKDGYVKKIAPNDGKKKHANISLEAWIIDRDVFSKILARSIRFDASYGIQEILASLIEEKIYKVYAASFSGYVRSIDSLEHYAEYSFELLNPTIAKELFRHDWPIFTLTHDTPPALYGPSSHVVNSFVSNGCVVDGEVSDSIICRNVKLAKGSVVKRSIILSNTSIGAAARISDVIIDKYSAVASKHVVEGDPENIVYIKQGAKL